MQALDPLVVSNFQDENLLIIVINFILCAMLAFVVRAFYIKYSTSLTGKHHIGTVLPILSLIVFLVILVVKSSLALSLGLVGALSIVRFRTPIKEPEELVYLFLSIAIGVGLGAGFTTITTVATLSILAIIYFFLSNKKVVQGQEFNLIINWKTDTVVYSAIIETLKELCDSVSLVRLSDSNAERSCVLTFSRKDNVSVDEVVNRIKKLDPNIDINIFQSTTNW